MKNLLRKVVAVVAAGATVFSIAACGSGGTSSDAGGSNKLTIAWWGNQQRNERTSKINEMFEQQHEGVSIDGQFSEMGDYFQKLSTAAAGKTLPDVMQTGLGYLDQYEQNGLLLDLKPYIDDGTIDVSKVDPNIIESVTREDGAVYAITNAMAAPALIYNKTILDQAGIEMPDRPTLEQFVDISRQVYEKTGMKTNFRYYEYGELLEYVVKRDNTKLYDVKNYKLGVDSPERLEEYFNVYQEGIDEGWHLAPEVFADLKAGSVEQDPLVYGTDNSRRSWCTFKYTSQFGAYQTQAANKGEELALATWPSANVKNSNYVYPSQFWTIAKTSKNPKLAAEWINFFINDLDANKVLLTDRGIPINSEIAEAIEPELSDADKEAITFINDVVKPESSPNSLQTPAGATEVNTQVLLPIEENLLYKKIDAKTAAQQYFDQANEILAKDKK